MTATKYDIRDIKGIVPLYSEDTNSFSVLSEGEFIDIPKHLFNKLFKESVTVSENKNSSFLSQDDQLSNLAKSLNIDSDHLDSMVKNKIKEDLKNSEFFQIMKGQIKMITEMGIEKSQIINMTKAMTPKGFSEFERSVMEEFISSMIDEISSGDS